jgi:hypothetical protein
MTNRTIIQENRFSLFKRKRACFYLLQKKEGRKEEKKV